MRKEQSRFFTKKRHDSKSENSPKAFRLYKLQIEKTIKTSATGWYREFITCGSPGNFMDVSEIRDALAHVAPDM